MHALRKLHPDLQVLENVSGQSRVVASEPLVDLPGAWNEVPESSNGIVRGEGDEMHEFRPRR